jgi:hypothetical protein
MFKGAFISMLGDSIVDSCGGTLEIMSILIPARIRTERAGQAGLRNRYRL